MVWTTYKAGKRFGVLEERFWHRSYIGGIFVIRSCIRLEWSVSLLLPSR
jgi:hypothetical protein